MKRHLQYLSLLIFCSLVLLSNKCSEEKNDSPIIDSTKVNNNVSPEQAKKDSVRAIKEDEYLKNVEVKEKKAEIAEKFLVEKNVTKDFLIGILPESVSGFDALPLMTGKTQETDTSFTIYIKKQFKNNQRKTLMFDIYDYGMGNPVPNKMIYDIPPQDLDAPAYPIQLPEAKGFFYWIDRKIYGHIEVIVANRFVVIVRLNGFNRDDKLLENYLKLVKLKDLISKVKN